jgi:hypothetical protein
VAGAKNHFAAVLQHARPAGRLWQRARFALGCRRLGLFRGRRRLRCCESRIGHVSHGCFRRVQVEDTLKQSRGSRVQSVHRSD